MRIDDKKLKALKVCIQELRQGIAIVEGKKDVESLKKCGIRAVKYNEIDSVPLDTTVFILTDIDKKGEELLRKIESSARLMGIKNINTVVRKRIAHILMLTRFEEMYEKIKKVEVKLWEKLI